MLSKKGLLFIGFILHFPDFLKLKQNTIEINLKMFDFHTIAFHFDGLASVLGIQSKNKQT